MISNKLLLNISDQYENGSLHLIGRPEFGTSNINYTLKTKDRKYFLKQYDSSKQSTVNKIIEVYKILGKEKIDSRILIPLRNKRDDLLTEFEGGFYFLFPFIDGKSTYNLNSQNIEEICEVLRNFYSVTRFIDPNHFFNKSYKTADLDINLLNALNIDTYYELSRLEDLADLVVINDIFLHGDTDFTNFLFTDKLIALLDIDECHLGDQREEVIKTILGFSLNRNNIPFNEAYAVEFLKYFAEIKFTKDIVDYFVYKHIFTSLNHFLLREKKSQDKINKLIINYFIEYLNSFRSNKENIYKIFNAL